MIPFNSPPYTGNEDQYVLEAMRSSKMSGDGVFSKKCQQWFEDNLPCKKALLTPSCTHALEMAAILIDVQPDDEIIMPSYTFVSTANAFVLRGAKIVFVDIRPDTMNMDETLIEAAITPKTKAIVPVHYAGVACEMGTIMAIAEKHGLYVIEDAAQGMMSTYKGKALGTIGHFGTYSFHETKNYTSAGEGGLLIINDAQFVERAEIIREKGTNRSQFFRGMVDKYSWVDIGSSYLMNDVSAAYLWGQLEKVNEINQDRLRSWNLYHEGLKALGDKGLIQLPQLSVNCVHNGHMFYAILNNLKSRGRFIDFMEEGGVNTVFHYVSLGDSKMGKKWCRVPESGLCVTESVSNQLVRLPLWFGLEEDDVNCVISRVKLYCDSVRLR